MISTAFASCKVIELDSACRQSSSRARLPAVLSQQSISELSEGDAEVDGLLTKHVPAAQLIARGASEMIFRLPKEDSSR